MVFCGLFPIDSDDYPELRDALEKLTLNDAALTWEPETSRRARASASAAASSACCTWTSCASGSSASTTSSCWRRCRRVGFEVTLTNGEELEVHAPSDMPDPARIAEVREPFIRASILTPKEYVGAGHGALPGAPRRARRHALPVAPSACSSPTTCRWPRSCSTSSTS